MTTRRPNSLRRCSLRRASASCAEVAPTAVPTSILVLSNRCVRPTRIPEPSILRASRRRPDRSALYDVRAADIPGREATDSMKLWPGPAGRTANCSARSKPAGRSPAAAHVTVDVVPTSTSNSQARLAGTGAIGPRGTRFIPSRPGPQFSDQQSASSGTTPRAQGSWRASDAPTRSLTHRPSIRHGVAAPPGTHLESAGRGHMGDAVRNKLVDNHTAQAVIWLTSRVSKQQPSRHSPAGSARLGDHSRANSGVRGLVDEDDAAGETVTRVRVAEQRLSDAQAHPADLVERQARRGFVPVQGVHVEPVVQIAHNRLRRPCRVLDDKTAARR